MTRPQGLRRFAVPPQQVPARPATAAPGTPPPAAGPPAAGPAGAGQPAVAGQPAGEGGEQCEICSTGIPAGHGHVADLEQSSLMCACRACYLLFTQPGAGRARYRSVPDRYLRDPDRALTPAEWDELQIPVGLAFFLYRSDPGELGCFYPSPAGATQCALDLPAWQRLAATHPLLGQAEPDVEAVLISQDEPAGIEYFIVPVDACYELAGRMRMLWRGFDGGTEARQSIAEFLAGVRRRAKPAPRDSSHG